MGTQRKIAQAIHDGGGDYVLAVKANQPELHDAVKSVMDIALDTPHESPEHSAVSVLDNQHGRLEIRRYVALNADAIEWAGISDKWPGLASVAAVESQVTKDGKTVTERRYYISSLPPRAKLIGKAIRSHWGVENSLHWVLDTTFREDHSKIRKDNSPENMVITRHFAMNLLKREHAGTASIKRKRNKAAFEPAYRTLLLTI